MEQIKDLFLDVRTWSALAYMVAQLPLGLAYFVAFFTLFIISVSLIVNPFLVYVLHLPVIRFDWLPYDNNPELMFAFVVVGLLLFVAMLHVSKIFGRLHAIYAKNLLVGGYKGLDESIEFSRNQGAQISEEPMEIKEEEKFEIDQRPPVFVIIISIAFFLFAMGLVILAFLTTQ